MLPESNSVPCTSPVSLVSSSQATQLLSPLTATGQVEGQDPPHTPEAASGQMPSSHSQDSAQDGLWQVLGSHWQCWHRTKEKALGWGLKPRSRTWLCREILDKSTNCTKSQGLTKCFMCIFSNFSTVGERCYSRPHVPDEETECQRGEAHWLDITSVISRIGI